jgi:hypothetical protein
MHSRLAGFALQNVHKFFLMLDNDINQFVGNLRSGFST